MKLLFDQNISFRIVEKIIDFFPESKQVRDLGLENLSDRKIWEFAKEQKFTIVTFDADFYDLANLRGYPPKIIWLRTGNMTTASIEEILKKKHRTIHEFILNDQGLSCLMIR